MQNLNSTLGLLVGAEKINKLIDYKTNKVVDLLILQTNTKYWKSRRREVNKIWE